MYSKISNPITNRNVNIYSKKGNLILKKYLTKLSGGSSKSNDNFFDMLEKFQGERMDDQRSSHIVSKIEPIKASTIKCGNKLGKKIGEGTYKTAYVTKCVKKIWGYEGEFSKSFKETDCKDSTILLTNEKNENFLREVDLQQKSKSPVIFKYGKCKDKKYNYKIEERFDEDLFDWLDFNIDKKISIMDNEELLNNFKHVFKQVLYQLRNLHEKNISHLDIKPENIMVKYYKDSRKIKKMVLTDYGFASEFPSKIKGTPNYIDPDIIHKSILTLKSDIYSLGITLLVSLLNSLGSFGVSDKVPFNEGLYEIIKYCPEPSESIENWISELFYPNNRKDPIFLDLLYHMLMCPRKHRYDINQVISHEWFNTDSSTV